MRLSSWRPQAASLPSSSPSLHPPRRSLTESQRRMYKLERADNFRWIARLLSSPSKRVLTSADLVSNDVQQEIANIGQYAELVHGLIDPAFVWRNLNRLIQPTYPLEEYDALEGSTLICVFRGEVAKLQGYIVHRPSSRQLIVAFSGTSSPLQALHDVDARMVPYPGGHHNSPQTTKAECKVHAGFWRMFQGLKQTALAHLTDALTSLDVKELVLTGHSLGAVQTYLFTMELLKISLKPPDTEDVRLPPGLIFKLVTFGSPRIGNEALSLLYRKLVSEYRSIHGEDSFQEYSVKGYNDGVPCLPPKAIEFRHLTPSPLYLFHGRLFRIPPSENEHTIFPVQLEDDELPPEFPLGGHNYYNNRDMEGCLRRLQCLDVLKLGETGWEERYLRSWKKGSQS
ncbi:alpha/beta-hydrolase [Fomitiporia mediterranea MF3/22]|uniref:alpha/beta-hydrolase n=1 Tax=Fomitiporia mediterranea (strain MF3/22) TaxID=694068 RepID=UPI0004408DFD|nr:alpha/beta-hydrolase [Fomitiporia mediterranea MF3/22]EJD03946.1 alpha/beta-hydrolase [Fomitiporia mediterranea MF3/22]